MNWHKIIWWWVLLLLALLTSTCTFETHPLCKAGWMRTFVALDQQYHSASVTVRGQLIEADRPGPGGICPNATNIKETAVTTDTQTPAPSPNEFIEIPPQAVYPGLWRIEVTANGDGCTWQRVCEQRLPDYTTSNPVYVFKDACISESGLRNHYDTTVPDRTTHND